MKTRTQDSSFFDALVIMGGLALLTSVSVAHSSRTAAPAKLTPSPAEPAHRMFVKHSHTANAKPSFPQYLQATTTRTGLSMADSTNHS